MNRRTLLCFTLLAVLLAAFGFGASAQEPITFRQIGTLPQNAAPLDTRISETPDLIAPDDMAEMRPLTDFQWNDTGASKYKLTFTENATGIKHTIKVKADKCNGTSCTIRPLNSSDIFDNLTDGMALTWQVTAIMPDGKIKSGVRTVTVNEVELPVLSGPADGSPLAFGGTVSWSNANIINQAFRLIVVDPATGQKVVNLYLNSHACGATCTITPRHFSTTIFAGTTYEWFVKAVSYTGETQNSEKRTFVAQ